MKNYLKVRRKPVNGIISERFKLHMYWQKILAKMEVQSLKTKGIVLITTALVCTLVNGGPISNCSESIEGSGACTTVPSYCNVTTTTYTLQAKQYVMSANNIANILLDICKKPKFIKVSQYYVHLKAYEAICMLPLGLHRVSILSTNKQRFP